MELSREQKEELNRYVLSEKDFYPPQDTRCFKSVVYDIPFGGDCYHDYARWFYCNYSEYLFDN